MQSARPQQQCLKSPRANGILNKCPETSPVVPATFATPMCYKRGAAQPRPPAMGWDRDLPLPPVRGAARTCALGCDCQNNPVHLPPGFPLIASNHQLPKSQLVCTSLSVKEGDVNCVIALPTPSETPQPSLAAHCGANQSRPKFGTSQWNASQAHVCADTEGTGPLAPPQLEELKARPAPSNGGNAAALSRAQLGGR